VCAWYPRRHIALARERDRGTAARFFSNTTASSSPPINGLSLRRLTWATSTAILTFFLSIVTDGTAGSVMSPHHGDRNFTTLNGVLNTSKSNSELRAASDKPKRRSQGAPEGRNRITQTSSPTNLLLLRPQVMEIDKPTLQCSVAHGLVLDSRAEGDRIEYQ
jgi:hypothetical protein